LPDFSAHITQAYHNCNLLNYLDTNSVSCDYADWYVTISFYAALHFVEALIEKERVVAVAPNGIKKEVNHSSDAKEFYSQGATKPSQYVTSDHVARIKVIRDNPNIFSGYTADYLSLSEDSRKARYFCHSHSKSNHTAAKKRVDNIKYLFEIKHPYIRAV
jgi:hypothetical protein